MPVCSAMSADDRECCLEEFDTKLLGIMAGESKLRERLANVPMDSTDAFEIRTVLLRLEILADRINRQKEQFEADQAPINPPNELALADMRERVGRIRQINAQNETARGIVAAIVAVAGALPNLPS